MDNNISIKTIAILGADSLGIKLAFRLADLGLNVYVFDSAAEEVHPNLFIEHTIKAVHEKNPNLVNNYNINKIIPSNYIQDLHKLQECGLIIDNSCDIFEWKRDLLVKISWYVKNETILLTNTSFLSINGLDNFLPHRLKLNFCGINVLDWYDICELVEVIPSKNTKKEVLDIIDYFFSVNLNKKLIKVNDSSHFVAGRIGIFSLMLIIYHSWDLKLAPDIVDLLLRPILGSKYAASFQSLDILGIDKFVSQVNSFKSNCVGEFGDKFFELPPWFEYLLNKRFLGIKSGCGVYKKNLVFNFYEKNYRPVNVKLSNKTNRILNLAMCPDYFHYLYKVNSPEAKFLWNYFRDLIAYCFYYKNYITDLEQDIDHAMVYGFKWQNGPFSIFNNTDKHKMIEYFEKDGIHFLRKNVSALQGCI